MTGPHNPRERFRTFDEVLDQRGVTQFVHAESPTRLQPVIHQFSIHMVVALYGLFPVERHFHMNRQRYSRHLEWLARSMWPAYFRSPR